jgi:YfiH family protein
VTIRLFTPAGWPANVRLVQTCRARGASAAPYDDFNLGDHVGDAQESVAANRAALGAALQRGTAISWLRQVHGTRIVQASAGTTPEADGSWSRDTLVACAVLTADCLPVLLSDIDGRVVAAAHAGWRGLAAGVLEATVAAMDEAPERLLAWLGPAIGPDAFQVGAEVRREFIESAYDATHRAAIEACFRADGDGRHRADLVGLAERRLRAMGLEHLQRDGACTVSDPARFFSYRRDGVTGRMASLVYRTGEVACTTP